VSRIRIFVSFDHEHDADLHDRLHAQSTSPGSNFEFSGCSRGGEMTQAWTASSRSRIRAADEVVVICGEHTHASPRMAAELRIAQEEERPYLLLWGRRELMCTRPTTARKLDGMYSWTWEILQGQIVSVFRSAGRTNLRPRAASRAAPKGPPLPPSPPSESSSPSQPSQPEPPGAAKPTARRPG
jgi:hypothetical protein